MTVVGQPNHSPTLIPDDLGPTFHLLSSARSL